MENRILSFKKSEYDPFIDYIKGFCILSVIILHSTPVSVLKVSLGCLWISMCVPLFLLVQVFHAYKKRSNITYPNMAKTWYRIIKPFVLVQLFLLVYLLVRRFLDGDINLYSFFKEFIISGGNGPGSYYFWIYLQFAFILPLFSNFLYKNSFKRIFAIFILISLLVEIVFSYLTAEPLYRLFLGRYLILIPLGYMLAFKGYTLNFKTCFGGVSALFVCLFYYKTPNVEPLVYDTGWNIHHWFQFFWLIPLMFILKYSYLRLNQYKIISYFKSFGKYSYEIYLFQMVWFTLPFYKILELITHTKYIAIALWPLISIFICCFGLSWFLNKKYGIKEKK